MDIKHYIVGVTGASGQICAYRLIDYFKNQLHYNVSVVISPAAEVVGKYELSTFNARNLYQDKTFVTNRYGIKQYDASIASGSCRTNGMIIMPCSMNTLSDIANSKSGNLITRSADVTLKERRQLILGIRETPLHSGHLDNMKKCADRGIILMPIMPSFYANLSTMEDMVQNYIGRVLDQLGINNSLAHRWGGCN